MGIWSASEGGPAGLMNTLNSYKAEDMLRAKTAADPDFQRAVQGFMADGTTTAQEAVDKAAKLYPGAKGYKPLTHPGLQDVALPPDVAGPPESRMMDIPQFPELSASAKLKDAKTQYQIDATSQPGPLGAANKAKMFGGVLDPDTANQFYNYQLGLAHASDKEHPGTSTTTSFDTQSGSKFKSSINTDMFPPHVFVKNPDTGEYEPKTPQDIMPNNQFDQMPNGGWKNKGLKPGYTSEQTTLGHERGKVQPLFGSEDEGDAGPMSDYLQTHPRASAIDVDLEGKRLTREGAATDKLTVSRKVRHEGITSYTSQLSDAADEGGDSLFGSGQKQYPNSMLGAIEASKNVIGQNFRSTTVGSQMEGNEALNKYLALKDGSKEILGQFLGEDKRFSDSELKILDRLIPNPIGMTKPVFQKRMRELPAQLEGFMQTVQGEPKGNTDEQLQATELQATDPAERFRAFIAKGGKK